MVEFVNSIWRRKSDSNRNFSSLPQPQNEFYAGEELKANTTNLYFFERVEMRKKCFRRPESHSGQVEIMRIF